MVNPVSGPHTEEKTVGLTYHLRKRWYRQKKPYTINLPYEYEVSGADPWTSSGNPFAVWKDRAAGVSTAPAYARAYDKLIEKFGESASLGVSLAQWKQADAMISKRGNQLLQFTIQLGRRNPLGVASALGISAQRARAIMQTRYGVSRKLSDLWLEFWFGWKPMFSDIYNAGKVFENDLPWSRIKGAGTEQTTVDTKPAPNYWGWRYTQRVRVSIGVDVRLRNPNLHLMNQLGLLNPAVVAWDVIPWSFVVGWLGNFDSYLRSLTDFAGWETSNTYVKRDVYLEGQTYWGWNAAWGPEPAPPANGFARRVYRDALSSVPRPSLVLKDWSTSPLRAMTAISLLIQKLPG